MKRIFALLTLTIVSSLFGEPRQWADEGVAVAIDKAFESVSSATNSDGYTLNVWASSVGGISVVVGQLVAPTGENLWEDEGRLVAEGERRAGYPSVIALSDGWIVGWLDALYIEWCDEPTTDGSPCLEAAIRVIKIDNNAVPLWNSGRAGIEVAPMREWADYTPFDLHPSGGGVIVTWGATYDHVPLRARGVSEAGVAWPESVVVGGEPYGSWITTTSDMQGGVLIAWSRVFYRDSVIHANRLLADGTLAWADAEGLAVINAHDTLEYVRAMCADGFGGMYVGWGTNRYVDEQWVQRLDGNGDVVWTSGAVRPCIGNGVSFVMSLATSYLDDAPDGVLISFGNDDRVQKLDLSGNRAWGNCGISICSEPNPGSLNEISTVSDQDGGAVVSGIRQTVDENGNFLYNEVHAARIANDGSLPWEDDCVAGGIAAGYSPDLMTPTIVGDQVRTVWIEFDTLSEINYRDFTLATGDPVGVEPVVVFANVEQTVDMVRTVRLSGGSTALVWIDRSYNSYSAKFQILDPFGEPQLAEGGAPLLLETGEPVNQIRELALCEDGAGGFFAFALIELEFSVQVRAIRFDYAGVHLTDPAGSIVMTARGRSVYSNLRSIPDAASGAYVTAGLYQEASPYAKANLMLVGTSCETRWAQPLEIGEDTLSVTPVGLTPGPEHSCVLTTATEDLYPSYSLTSARVESDRAVHWSVSIVDSARYAPYETSVCANADGGVYVCWLKSSDFDQNLLVQQVASDGAILWDTEGVLLGDSGSYARELSCAVDASGILTVVWNSGDWNDGTIKGQRLNPEGELQWPQGGLIICDEPQNQQAPKVVAVSDNEAYVAWEDYRDDPWSWIGRQLYGTHLNALGEIAGDSWWVENGNAISPAGQSQSEAVFVADGAGGAVVAWIDRRTGFGYWHGSLFAQRLYDPIFTDADEKPVVATEFALEQNYPNPFNPETVIEFALPNASKATLKVFDITGREVATLVDERLSAGNHRVQFDGSQLASGVYFYSLRAETRAMTRKMVMLK